MLLFILESIGTSELILIGIIALIFLGPRKLPQIARTIGKTMADFRNTTNEFKSTWQREVDFEEEVSAIRTGELADAPPLPVPRTEPALDSTNSIAPPSIKPIQTDLFDNVPAEAKPAAKKDDDTPADDDLSDKRNWL
jgi:Tat protein translocase TatB subunit